MYKWKFTASRNLNEEFVHSSGSDRGHSERRGKWYSFMKANGFICSAIKRAICLKWTRYPGWKFIWICSRRESVMVGEALPILIDQSWKLIHRIRRRGRKDLLTTEANMLVLCADGWHGLCIKALRKYRWNLSKRRIDRRIRTLHSPGRTNDWYRQLHEGACAGKTANKINSATAGESSEPPLHHFECAGRLRTSCARLGNFVEGIAEIHKWVRAVSIWCRIEHAGGVQLAEAERLYLLVTVQRHDFNRCWGNKGMRETNMEVSAA